MALRGQALGVALNLGFYVMAILVPEEQQKEIDYIGGEQGRKERSR